MSFPVSVSHAFWNYIDGLPWSNNRVDYKTIGRKIITLDLWVSDYSQVKDFLQHSSLSKYKYMVVASSNHMELTMIPFDGVELVFDELVSRQGDVAIFAANSENEYFFNEFLLAWSWRAVAFASMCDGVCRPSVANTDK